MKDKVSQEYVCEEEVPLNNNIGKQIGDFVDMPSEAVEQGMDANVPDEIDGAKDEQVPNHVVKKANLEFLVCKQVANPGVRDGNGFLALGWILEEIHVTWDHLEKKQTRLRTYTKSLEDLCKQCLETASQA
ncbi:hypothetical protein Tco_0214687 [Tanacetum coccineum]